MASVPRTALKRLGQQDEVVVEGAALEEWDVTMFVSKEMIKYEFDVRDSASRLIKLVRVSMIRRLAYQTMVPL